MKVNLQKSYAALQESIVTLLDNLGVPRSVAVPYQDGEEMGAHVQAVGVAANAAGGTTRNLLFSMHHSDGTGWGSGDGHTVGFSSDKLRSTIIPDGDEDAKVALDAAQKHLNNLATLLAKDNPTIRTAQGQLDLAKRTSGAGMTALDFGILLSQIFYRPTQLVAKMHSGTKKDGHAAHLRAPASAPVEETPEAPAASETDEQTPTTGQQAPSPAPTSAQG